MDRPRNLLGIVLLLAAAVLLVLAARFTPTIVLSMDPSSSGGLVPSPYSFLLTPALLAAGSVLLTAGVAALVGSELSARGAFAAPAIAVLTGIALGVGVTDPAVLTTGSIGDEWVTTAFDGYLGSIVAGAIVGGTVAPVVRAAITGDTVALLVAAGVLLAAVATASAAALPILTGGAGGVAAVAVLLVVDDAWRP